MQIKFPIAIVIALMSSVNLACAQADDDCRDALVLATYSKSEITNEDWRLASFVTENDYNTIKHDAGINAVIYGVPVGASYSDYQKSVKEKTNSYNESLTQSQKVNVMWTGLDPNAKNTYSECLKTKIFSKQGLHLGVQSATKQQVSVAVAWTPIGTQRVPRLEWQWTGQGSQSLPRTVQPGIHIVVLPRPDKQQILAVNYKGYADQLILEPYPAPPAVKPKNYIETSEEYRSPEQVGWGDNWSKPYTLCTPSKPADWIVVKVEDFHLESNTERNNCGRWTTCGGQEADTATRVCRTTSVQGHNESRFDGYGKMVSVFHVTWKHPE